MTRGNPVRSFDVYRWKNPETTCDYPYLAVDQTSGALLSLGSYGLCFEWSVPEEVARWLALDFAPTGERIACDLQTVRCVLLAAFAGGAEFGLVSFDGKLQPSRLELSLTTQLEADAGPEYLIYGLGSYQRFFREANAVSPVSLSERALLDVCAATFADLAAEHPHLITEPPPPRYRSSPALSSFDEDPTPTPTPKKLPD